MTTENSRAVSLFCREGSSDKVYQCSLQARESGWVVEFAFGKRGTALKTGTKTSTPVSYADAAKVFEKLVKEKTAKGYTEDQSGVAYTNTEHSHRASGVLPQLPTAADPLEVPRLLADPAWGLQEKRDGENRLLLIKSGQVRGINRKGLFVDVPQAWADLFSMFPDCLLAGEAVAQTYYVFDLLEFNGADLRGIGFGGRYAHLVRLFDQEIANNLRLAGGTLLEHFKLIRVFEGHVAKKTVLAAIELENGEGVVFKKLNAEFEAGKCRSALKHKFVESATCVVLRVNQQRSVAVGLRDESGVMVDLGNVTIPLNFTAPAVGDLAEIRYLYRFEDGCFEQAVYLGGRSDLDVEDAVLSQVTRTKKKVALPA